MIIFSRKTHGCWVPPFLETSIWNIPCAVIFLRSAPLRLYTCVRIQKNISPLQDQLVRIGRQIWMPNFRDPRFCRRWRCFLIWLLWRLRSPEALKGPNCLQPFFKPELSLDSSQEQGLQKHLKVLCGISHPHLCKAGSVALPRWEPRCIQDSLEGWYVLPRISLGQPWSTFISIMDFLLTSLRVWAWISFLTVKFD